MDPTDREIKELQWEIHRANHEARTNNHKNTRIKSHITGAAIAAIGCLWLITISLENVELKKQVSAAKSALSITREHMQRVRSPYLDPEPPASSCDHGDMVAHFAGRVECWRATPTSRKSIDT